MTSPATTSCRPQKKPKLAPTPENKWRTGAELERAYHRHLLEAICAASSRCASSCPRSVKEAADFALALTASGQSCWSRAILLGRSCRGGRLKLLLKAGGRIRRRRRPRPRGKKVRDRLRALGRMVPGCGKLSAPNLLEEAADYVAALEMQVKAMRALADALSAVELMDR